MSQYLPRGVVFGRWSEGERVGHRRPLAHCPILRFKMREVFLDGEEDDLDVTYVVIFFAVEKDFAHLET
jgi:hypothetical protein